MDLETAVKKFNDSNPYRKVIGYWKTNDGFVLLSDNNGSVAPCLFLVNEKGVQATTPMRTKIDYGKMKFYVSQ